MKKIILTLTLSILASLAFSQTSFTVDGINYTKTSSNTVGVSIGGTYKGYKGSITIPSSVSYSGQIYNVTSIESSAFSGCTDLTNITIPPSITSIGSSAFDGCTGLTTITIPSSVTSIINRAFSSCTALITVESNNNYYSSKDGVLYNKYFTTLIQCPTSLKQWFTIPSSVTSIGDFAFYSCTGLTTITIPSSVTSIGNTAFCNCTGLTSVSIPSSVTSIGGNAFWNCTGLTSISIPSSVTSIGNTAFSGCSGLTTITIPPSVTSIGVGAFLSCTSLINITIPSSVTTIGLWAFLGCTALINVESNNSNYSSKDGVLYNKDYTTLIQCPISINQEFTIPSSVTSIRYYAFSGCKGLITINIPPLVTSIGDYAFSGCSGLTSITIPTSITSIGKSAFSGCKGLITINIPPLVTSIGDYTFSGCSSLTTIPISSSVTSIGKSAFDSCRSLTTITIPPSVTLISQGAFSMCTSLASINIPPLVTSIGSYAFNGCTALSEIRVHSVAPPTLVSNTFNQIDKSKCTLYVPMGSLNTYKSTEQWKDFLNIVEFDATEVENLGSESIKLYPNPTSQFIYINLVNNIDSHILKIFNASGQKFYEMHVSDNHIQIDVSSFPSGLYFIQTTDQNNRVTNIGRFIRE